MNRWENEIEPEKFNEESNNFLSFNCHPFAFPTFHVNSNSSPESFTPPIRRDTPLQFGIHSDLLQLDCFKNSNPISLERCQTRTQVESPFLLSNSFSGGASNSKKEFSEDRDILLNWEKYQLYDSSKDTYMEDNPIQTIDNSSRKGRMRWTNELHEQFVLAVNRLGGATRATPKGILKLMKLEGITIFHIKSHLQKYRASTLALNSHEVKSRKMWYEGISGTNQKRDRFQIGEVLHLQMDFQKKLHEQWQTVFPEEHLRSPILDEWTTCLGMLKQQKENSLGCCI